MDAKIIERARAMMSGMEIGQLDLDQADHPPLDTLEGAEWLCGFTTQMARWFFFNIGTLHPVALTAYVLGTDGSFLNPPAAGIIKFPLVTDANDPLVHQLILSETALRSGAFFSAIMNVANATPHGTPPPGYDGGIPLGEICFVQIEHAAWGDKVSRFYHASIKRLPSGRGVLGDWGHWAGPVGGPYSGVLSGKSQTDAG